MKSILVLGILVLATTSFANKLDDMMQFPPGCYQEGYSFKHHTLNLYPSAAGNDQSMYFIHNLSQQTVKFYHMKTGDETFVVHLNSAIEPDKWHVFATDEMRDKFICTQDDGTEYGEIIDCASVLDVCEYSNVKFAITNKGSYWVVENETLRAARRSAIEQGSLLRN